MGKRIKNDCVSIDVSGGVTFTELTNKYSEKYAELITKYDNVHNIKVTCNSYEYNDGENYTQELIIYFDRDETDEEYKTRLDWMSWRKKEQEDNDIKRLKELIQKYPTIAEQCLTEVK